MRRPAIIFGTLALTAGCHSVGDGRLAAKIHTLPGWPKNQLPPPAPTTYSQYHLENWDWAQVARVLVLPPLNATAYTRADEEFHAALAGELQRLGRFEVVAGPPDDCARLAATIHRDGTFDEAVMLELARLTKADVVIHVAITQYSPYPRPRIGLVVQAVSPAQGKVVASVDGLWDTTDAGIAEDVRTYYRQRPKPLPPRVRNHQIVSDDAFAEELALDSPALFQRWVGHKVSETLLGIETINGMLIVPAAATQPATGGTTGGNCNTCGPRKTLFPLKR